MRFVLWSLKTNISPSVQPDQGGDLIRQYVLHNLMSNIGTVINTTDYRKHGDFYEEMGPDVRSDVIMRGWLIHGKISCKGHAALGSPRLRDGDPLIFGSLK